MNPIIVIENLSKQYRVGGPRPAYGTLREAIVGLTRWPVTPTVNRRPASLTHWALRDVNLQIVPGEVTGIVGNNGAGKSTLLKILARITEPTEGLVDLYGRVGSLLEVGAGFHPELTGRENVFLSGAILGMKNREIKRKFDEIVAFAEVDKYVDTPVKHYSSGMYMRLAFGVAAHLETEILLVDEILAVGDAQFQRKCFAKIQESGRQGRTVLFVSHNIAALRQFCSSAILLHQGRVAMRGDTNRVIDHYLGQMSRNHDAPLLLETPSFLIKDVTIASPDSAAIKTFSPVEIRVHVKAKSLIRDPGLYVGILTADNQRIAGLDFKDFDSIPPIPDGREVVIGFSVDAFPVLAGNYNLEVYLKDMASHRIERVPRFVPFTVVETPVYGGRNLDGWFGVLGLKARPFSVVHENHD